MRLPLTCALIGCKSERQYKTSDARDRLCAGFYGDIESVVRRAVFRGAGTFMCSGSGLINMMLGEAVLRVKKDFPALKLLFIIPYKGQEKYWSAPMRLWYSRLLARADNVQILEAEYTPGAFKRCNELMLALAPMIICIPGGVCTDAFRSAVRRGKDILSIPLPANIVLNT